MRRRAAVAVVAALLAASAVTGCASDGLSGGTAAVLGGQRIGVGTIEDRVAELRHATTGGSADAREQTDGPARQAVAELVLEAVVARALADRGLTVTDEEVVAVRTAEELRHGSPDGLTRTLARQGIPAPGIDGYYRSRLGIRLLATAAGHDAEAPSGETAVRHALADAATALHLRINPRYGTWDPHQVALLPDNPPWLATNG